MPIVKIRVDDGVNDRPLRLLSWFDKNGVEISFETADFEMNQKYLTGE